MPPWPGFPDPGQVSLSHSEDAPDLLHVFLSTAEEVEQSVMVVTGPAVFLTPAQAARHRPAGRNPCQLRV